MKVLIACEESQEVCKAFRRRGHEAYSCDIQEPSGGHPEWHILGDAVTALRGGGGQIVTMNDKGHYIDAWDLLIAHPPCTYLSNAGARHLKKTCLWLKNLPPLFPTDIVTPIATWCPSGSYSKKHGQQHKGMFTTDRAKSRAKTFTGVANAMSEQWG